MSYRVQMVLWLTCWALVALSVAGLCWGIAGCVVRPVPDSPGRCVEACQNMRSLGVEGWQGSPGQDEIHGTTDDVECRLVCESTEAAGFPFHSVCLAESRTRAEADRCYE